MNATTGVVAGALINPAVMGEFIFTVLVIVTTNYNIVNDSVFDSGKVCDFSSPYLNGLPVIQLTNE